MNSRSNFVVISLACLCFLSIWSSSESRSRRDTASGRFTALLNALYNDQLTEEEKNNIIKAVFSSLNKKKQAPKATSQPDEMTTPQSSTTAELSTTETLTTTSITSKTGRFTALLNALYNDQLTEEEKNNIIKAVFSSLIKTQAEKQEIKLSQPNETTTRQSLSTAELSTKEILTATAKTTPRSKTTTTKTEIASTSSTMKVASTQKSSTLKVTTTSKSTKATSQTNEMTIQQSSTTAELSTKETSTTTSTSKPTSKITKTDIDTDISKSSTMEAASTQKSSTSKVATTSKSPKTTRVTEITTRKHPIKSVPHTGTSSSPERHTTPANTLPSTQPLTSISTPKTARESSTVNPSNETSVVMTDSLSTPSKTSKQLKQGGRTTTSHSSTSGSEGISDRLFKHSSNFPPVFMVILVVIVAIYFGYHHRNKIHKFIKEGLSQPKHRGPGYLKVKVEDDTIALPREANTEYIY